MSVSDSSTEEEEERSTNRERVERKNASNTSLTANNSIHERAKEDLSASSTGHSDSDDGSDAKEESLHRSSARDTSHQSFLSSPENLHRRRQATHDRSASLSPTKGGSGDALDEPVKPKESSAIISYVSILVVVAAIIGGLYYYKPDGGDVQPGPTPRPVVVFSRKMAELRKQTDQDEKLWRIMISTMKTHLEDEEPRQPHVLMLASKPDAARTRERIAKDVAAAYSARCVNKTAVQVLGKDYANMQHFDAKERVDEAITAGLGDGACAVVVSNFEALPPASTKVFYQFCENDFAPFKAASVIFTLEVTGGSWDSDNRYNSLQGSDAPKSKFWDDIVDSFLYHCLSTRDGSGAMKKDMIAGLLTRITPSVAWVKADENFN